MLVKLEDIRVLIERAKYLMSKYSINEFEALKIAEKEIEEKIYDKEKIKYRR